MLKNRKIKFYTIFFITIYAISFSFYGCNSQPPPLPAKKAKKPDAVKSVIEPVSQEDTAVNETFQAGYVYEQKGRRDPFVPLIVPTKKLEIKDDLKTGTLEGYDLSEFSLSAIARKGSRYFALIVAPDNRSFTVHKGTVIGLSKGKVEEISEDKVTLVEYTKNFKGELKPRKITLEFHKGE